MTAKQVFAATEIELSKVHAPALKLYEFNYLFNKAINLYINKVYNTYDINQQTTDDLRVLKSTAYLTPEKFNPNNSATHNGNLNASSYLSRAHSSIQSLHGATYEVALPIDYLHLLNCVCIYYVAKTKDCWDAGSYIEVPATRLTADSWSTVLSDIYNKPSPMKPYYYIHNQNNSSNNKALPTDPITDVSSLGMPNGTDMTGTYTVTSNGYAKTVVGDTIYYSEGGKIYSGDTYANKTEITGSTAINAAKTAISSDTAVTTMVYPSPEDTVGIYKGGKLVDGSNFPRTFKLDFDGDEDTTTGDSVVSLVEKPIGLRAGNVSNVRMEIRYGKDDSLFQLKEVLVDYVKVPQVIRLTLEQYDLTEDTSQIMEFPDYVNQEIINELVHLIMVRNNDPGLSNNIQMTQSIARPTGQLAQTQAAARG